MIKKYLISLQHKGEPRYDQFFSNPVFRSEEFKVFGIRGSGLSSQEYFLKGVAGSRQPLSPAELGCKLSHVAALTDFLNSDALYAYVFEDDVSLKHGFEFSQQLDHLGKGFILSLGGVKLTLCKTVRGKILEQQFCQRPVLLVNRNYMEDTSYAMGYVMDRLAARHYLEYQQEIHVADDWKGLLKTYPNINYYMVDILAHPDLHELNHVNSTIESERSSQPKQKLKYNLFYFLQLYYQYKAARFKRKVARYLNQLYPD